MKDSSLKLVALFDSNESLVSPFADVPLYFGKKGFEDWMTKRRFKDPVGFVQAVPGVLKAHPKARFLVVGDGPLRSAVEKQACELGVQDSVRLTGNRTDVAAILRASMVFVANSPVTNCYSMTIQEAMTAGVPVVLTDVGDPTGSYKSKHYVELAKPRSPDDLARAINNVLSSGALRTRLIEMGRMFLRDYGFSPEIVIEQTMDAYRQLTGSGVRARDGDSGTDRGRSI